MLAKHHFQCRLIAALALAAGVVLLDAHGGDFVGPPAPDNPDSHDPFPIRRVLLARDRLPFDLEREKEGAWQRMSRRDFESLIRAAERGAWRQVVKPRIVETHYRAKLLRDTLDENSLDGSAEWKIASGNTGRAIMPLDSLGVALKQARWANNNNAVIGLIDPKSPPGFGLLVEERGEQSLALEWSARGIAVPGELRFDLALPICPIAVLDLELPANLAPVLTQDEVLVQGPIAVANEPRKMNWRIVFGGLSHLELSLRNSDNALPRMPILINLASHYELSAGAMLGQFTYEFQASRSDIASILFEHEADLTPTDVSVLNLESWMPVAPGANGRKRLEVRLREPARGGQIRISARGIVPLNDSTYWTAPAMNMVGAAIRSESVRIQIASELRLVDWRPGSFRSTRVEPGVNSSTLVCEPSVLSDGQNTMIRPSARLQLTGSEFRVRQITTWTVDANRSTLASQVDLELIRGTINSLQFRLPPDAEVEKVVFNVGERDARWTLQPGPNPSLRVELARPLVSGVDSRLFIELRLPGADPGGQSKDLGFPDVIPLGARQRSGEYRVRVGRTLAATAPAARLDDQFVGPHRASADEKSSEWVYHYYAHPPAGPLRVAPRLPRFSAAADYAVQVELNHLQMVTRLALQSESGAVREIVLFGSEPLANPPSFRTTQGPNRVLSVDAVPLDGFAAGLSAIVGRQPLQAATRLVAASKGHWWRITFAKPLNDPLLLEANLELNAPLDAIGAVKRCAGAIGASPNPFVSCISHLASIQRTDNGPIAVPLLIPVHALRLQGSIRVVRPVNRGEIRAGNALVRESEVRDPFTIDTRFRIADGIASLTIDPNKTLDERSPLRVDTARLVSAADSSGRRRCWFSFRVRGEISQRLSIGLPPSSEVDAVAVSGRILRPEQIQCTSFDGVADCSIALPSGDGWQIVEVLYSMSAPHWWLTTHLSPEVPRLPIQPSLVNIEWRLPPDAAPVDTAGLTRLPDGSDEQRRTEASWIASPWGESPPAFREFADERRFAPTPKGTLPKTVQQALLNPAGTGEKPLIDTVGLQEAGVRETTLAPPGGWDTLGLTQVAFPGGTVLTTTRQASIWRANGNSSNSIQQELTEALRNGRDASGRFRTIADWLESSPSNQAHVLLPHLGGDGPGWTRWQQVETRTPNGIEVVHKRNVTLIGWLVAAFLAVVGISLVGRLGLIGTILLGAWLFIAGAALQWLPVALRGLAIGPMGAGLLVALISTLRRKGKRSELPTAILSPSTRRRIQVAPAIALALAIWWLAVAATAAAPEPVTVYLLPGSAEDPEPKSVLVPIDLINRLKALADPAPAVTESVILDAIWTGRGRLNSADFEARLSIYSFVKRGRIELPLGEARLREALLDGAAAFPKPTGNGRYTLEVEGEGEHRIDLKFSVAVSGAGADRDVRFNIPEAAIASLAFQLPPGGDRPQVMNWQGAQNLSGDSKDVRADMGRAKSVQLRWRQFGVNVVPLVRVQESAVWDLSQSSATLYAAFDYRVTQGSLQSVKVAVPPNVEISRLEIRPDSNTGVAPPTWIRDWSMSANRELRIELQTGLTGSFQLVMEAVASRSLLSRPTLQYPVALEVAERETYVAYRLRGLDSSADLERRGVTDFSADSFLKDIWRPAGLEQAPAAVTRAFRRAKNEVAFLRPNVAIIPSAAQATQELFWHLGPRIAELNAAVRWQSGAEPLTFVEWEVADGLVVHDVRGANLHSWLRLGNRIQAWLREPAQEVAVHWHGEAKRGGQPAETSIFDLPLVRLDGVRTATTTVHASTPIGWALSLDTPAAVGASAATTGVRDISWSLAKPSASARFIVRGMQGDAVCKVISVAEVIQRQFRLTAFVEAGLRGDRPHSLAIALRDTNGWDVNMQIPAGCLAWLQSRHADRQEWLLDIPIRDGQRIPLEIVFTRAIGAAQEIPLPRLELSEGDRPLRMDNWSLLVGPEMRIQEAGNLRPTNDKLETLLANHPRDLAIWRERGISLWRAEPFDSAPTVRAAAEPLSASPVARLGLLDVEAARSGNHWIYRASIDLVHETGAPLECRLPAGGTLVGWAVDGVEAPMPANSDRFIVPLPFKSGPRLVQLVWTAADASWDPPIFKNGLNQSVDVPVIWTAIAAPGERLEASTSESLALHDLKRADSLVRLAAERGSFNWSDEALAQTSSRILRRVRFADVSLTTPRSNAFAAERGPNGIALADWAARLREQAQAMRVSRPPSPSVASAAPIRETTFDKLPYADVFRTGSPIRWSVGSQALSHEPRIAPATGQSPLPALASVSLIAIIVTTFSLLMLFLSRTTRPEQLGLIGILGVAAFGMPQAFLFFGITATAVVIRSLWASRRVYRWLGG